MSTSMPYPFPANQRPEPQPPTMHWAIVLLLTIVTFSLFGFFWAFRQALFIKKIDPTNPKSRVAVLEVGASFALAMFSGIIGAVSAMTVARGGVPADLGVVLNIVHTFQWVFFAVASLLVRNALVACYGVKMNQFLTVLFSIFYVQHHMTRIAKLQIPRVSPGSTNAQVIGNVAPGHF
jgi:hypothetical protein